MLVATLEAIFKPEGIAFLTELESSYKKKFASERHHLIGVCKCLLNLIVKKLVVAPEHLREMLGCEFNVYPDEDKAKCKRRWFGGITHRTVDDYSSRLADALTLACIFLDDQARAQANIVLDSAFLSSLSEFEESGKDVEDVCSLVLAMLNTNAGVNGNYNNSLLCFYPVMKLLTNQGVDTANKGCSSLKFLCRGIVLLELLQLTGHSPLSENLIVQNLSCETGGFNSFAQLNRLHKGICSMDSNSTRKHHYIVEGSYFRGRFRV